MHTAMGGAGGEEHLPPHTKEIIEVKSGPYVGEDDIVRFADDYGGITGECREVPRVERMSGGMRVFLDATECHARADQQ